MNVAPRATAGRRFPVPSRRSVPLPTLPFAALAFNRTSFHMAKACFALARQDETIARAIRRATPPPYRPRS